MTSNCPHCGTDTEEVINMCCTNWIFEQGEKRGAEDFAESLTRPVDTNGSNQPNLVFDFIRNPIYHQFIDQELAKYLKTLKRSK